MELYQSLQRLLADKKLVESLDPETRYCSFVFTVLVTLVSLPSEPMCPGGFFQVTDAAQMASHPVLLLLLVLSLQQPLLCQWVQSASPSRWMGGSTRAGPGLTCSLRISASPPAVEALQG